MVGPDIIITILGFRAGDGQPLPHGTGVLFGVMTYGPHGVSDLPGHGVRPGAGAGDPPGHGDLLMAGVGAGVLPGIVPIMHMGITFPEVVCQTVPVIIGLQTLVPAAPHHMEELPLEAIQGQMV